MTQIDLFSHELEYTELVILMVSRGLSDDQFGPCEHLKNHLSRGFNVTLLRGQHASAELQLGRLLRLYDGFATAISTFNLDVFGDLLEQNNDKLRNSTKLIL
ncbi:hypothetical protein SLS57_012446 [Botryosphaeria dothidea]